MSFTIRELESLSGIKAHTIRIWEQRFNFLKPSRTVTNIRTYSNEELKTLLTVALLNKYGYKISKIDQMEPEQRSSAIMRLSQDDANLENLVNEMIGYMIDLKCIEFEELLNQEIKRSGLEKTITGIIFYFLEKVGILWQTNKVIPVQEHIVTNIIRQKIVSAIEGISFIQRKGPMFILFLPEDEHHEMGLLFVYYLLRKQNIPVIYLGANVPVKDLEYLLHVKSPQYLYLHLTTFKRQHQLQKYISGLSTRAKNSKILLSGAAATTHDEPLPANVVVFQTFHEVVSYISSV